MAVDGFTSQEDRVAFLFYKNGRTSKLELRHRYGVQNPAEAINASEAKYHYKVQTGPTQPNGDVPYRLIEGSIPAIAGTIPLFNDSVIDDISKDGYVVLLDDYRCTVCWRHPVFSPTDEDGVFHGVCPLCGPAATFDEIARP